MSCRRIDSSAFKEEIEVASLLKGYNMQKVNGIQKVTMYEKLQYTKSYNLRKVTVYKKLQCIKSYNIQKV
jgi:hypothetical protein